MTAQEDNKPNGESVKEHTAQGKTRSEATGDHAKPRIIYRVEYRHSITDKLVYEYKTPDLDVELDEPEYDTSGQTIFEIVTVFKTAAEEKKAGSQLTASQDPTVTMKIRSKAIINAIQSVTTYYPSQDLSGDELSIEWPFAILVHHEDELKEFRESCAPTQDRELCAREKDAYEHLGILQDFLEAKIMTQVREERERNERGKYTFDLLWVHCKPGSTVYLSTREDPTDYGYVVRSLTGGTFNRPSSPWMIQTFFMEYDGTYLGRASYRIYDDKFDGEKDLFYTKVDFEKEHDEDTKGLIERGKSYYALIEKQCKQYTGTTMVFPNRDIDGLVMADMTTFYKGEGADEKPTLSHMDADSRTWVSDCTCSVCRTRRASDKEKRKEPFAKYDRIVPRDRGDLSDHQYFLCAQGVWSFVFKSRTWEKLSVQHFSEPKFAEDMIQNLVMAPGRVETLKALSKAYVRLDKDGNEFDRPLWTADFVQGKGHGLIFLLHGKPGVGKTCTAECIAGFTKRPLMVLTSSDIGTDPKEVESNLTSHFKTAKSWGAVLLIDEADVFMERRSTDNLIRNSLVAGFLRALEFYDGILFLTTNRVGAFDDAFVSRIHVQLYYPDLTDDDRKKIWKTFVDKLKKDRGDVIRMDIEAREYLAGNEIKTVKWNGREIRNAFQTAVALAEYEAEKDEDGKILLKEKHLKSIVEMSRDFKEYLDKLHVGDEDKRAERNFERLGKFSTV